MCQDWLLMVSAQPAVTGTDSRLYGLQNSLPVWVTNNEFTRKEWNDGVKMVFNKEAFDIPSFPHPRNGLNAAQ